MLDMNWKRGYPQPRKQDYDRFFAGRKASLAWLPRSAFVSRNPNGVNCLNTLPFGVSCFFWEPITAQQLLFVQIFFANTRTMFDNRSMLSRLSKHGNLYPYVVI